MVKSSQPERGRSRLKIYLDILLTIDKAQRARSTHILYQANLSYDRLTKYLGELRERGLISEIADGDAKYFEVTKKGKEFMKEVERAQAFVGAFGLDI